MGIDYEKCDKCRDCIPTEYFPNCFCCEDLIEDLCCDCVPERNYVDD